MRLALCTLLVGCATAGEPGVYTPEVDPGHNLEGWSGAVYSAVREWNDALYEECGWPGALRVGPGGTPVLLVDRERWEDEGMGGPEGTVIGWAYTGYGGEWISVKSGLTPELVRSTLLHEIGHTLGLAHIPRSVRPSIMNPAADNRLWPEDALAVCSPSS